MGFEVGQTAGEYELVGLLETSRHGRAFKARNMRSGRFEVLRVLPKVVQDDSEEMDRLLRGVKIHGRLSHPNIISFYATTEIEGRLAMTSEYFDGITLDKRLEAGPMAPGKAIACLSQVLAALHYAHGLGITHREVSPSHIVLGGDGIVKLTGFELAKTAHDPQLTKAGTVMGWLEYMSPEQVNGAVELDGRADIYSAGAVLYEAVAGQVPFVCKSQFDLMMAHVNTKPEPPAGVNPDLANIILTALEKSPSARFQTAGQFREALQRLSPAPPAAALESIPEPPLSEAKPAEQWGSQKLVLTGVLTFVVVLVVFLAFFKIGQALLD